MDVFSGVRWDEELVRFIKEVGFPVVVAMYFMIRNDRKQDKIIDLLQEGFKAKRLPPGKGKNNNG